MNCFGLVNCKVFAAIATTVSNSSPRSTATAPTSIATDGPLTQDILRTPSHRIEYARRKLARRLDMGRGGWVLNR